MLGSCQGSLRGGVGWDRPTVTFLSALFPLKPARPSIRNWSLNRWNRVRPVRIDCPRAYSSASWRWCCLLIVPNSFPARASVKAKRASPDVVVSRINSTNAMMPMSTPVDSRCVRFPVVLVSAIACLLAAGAFFMGRSRHTLTVTAGLAEWPQTRCPEAGLRPGMASHVRQQPSSGTRR
jgi:hypothetical protein